jgi:hypothetical protein
MTVNNAAKIIQSKKIVADIGKTICQIVNIKELNDGRIILNSNLTTNERIDSFISFINESEDLTGTDIQKAVNKVNLSIAVSPTSQFIPEKGDWVEVLVDKHYKTNDFRMAAIKPLKQIKTSTPDLSMLFGFDGSNNNYMDDVL